MTVDYKTYSSEKSAFIKKHGKKDWRVETSSMDEYGVYYKTYIMGDGSTWFERMSPVWEKAEAEVVVKGITVKISQDVKLFETEYWDTDNANSRKYYEKF